MFLVGPWSYAQECFVKVGEVEEDGEGGVTGTELVLGVARITGEEGKVCINYLCIKILRVRNSCVWLDF